MYSEVGPQGAASVIQKGVLHGGVGEGDVLLGEARVPFSLLKDVPFHYLPLRIQRPPPTPRPLGTACGCESGVEPTPRSAGGNNIDGHYGIGNRIPRCSGGCTVWNTVETNVSGADENTESDADAGLLGIGVRMVFPNPSIPDAPDASSCDGSVNSSILPPSVTGCVEAGKGAAGPCMATAAAGDKIVLRVYEAEALVREWTR